ncbi:MAG: DUF3617 family protein [Betaproteobacteria bacterium]|nr:DUF3617 family protein [Betaproteobacteria bacterium]
MHFLVQSLLLCVFLAPIEVRAVGDVAPGKWEITTKVAVPKLPFGLTVPGNLPLPLPLPQSGTRAVCISEEDVDQPQAFVKAQTGCLLQDLQGADGQFKWKVSCDSPPRSRGTGRLTVNEDTLQGTATLITAVQGFELPVSMRYSGRRLGECSR